jgi:hypothetical protein
MVSFVCCLLSAVEVDLGNFDVINNLLHVDRIHIDNFGDDLESLDSNSENNDLCVDDDVH